MKVNSIVWHKFKLAMMFWVSFYHLEIDLWEEPLIVCVYIYIYILYTHTQNFEVLTFLQFSITLCVCVYIYIYIHTYIHPTLQNQWKLNSIENKDNSWLYVTPLLLSFVPIFSFSPLSRAIYVFMFLCDC